MALALGTATVTAGIIDAGGEVDLARTASATSPPDSMAPPPTEAATVHGGHAGGSSSGQVPIDEDAIPQPQPSRDEVFIGPSISDPEYLDGVGAFRINCSYSHLNFDDPIVYPGEPGAAHLHIFFGNDGVDASSDAASIADSGGTTCTGGTANRSAYWVPAVIDTVNGAPIVATDEDAVQVYYKTGYDGVPSADVQNMPAGLRIVAGSASNATAGDLQAVWYTCVGDDPVDAQAAFPACSPGDLFVMSVEFPQCWDGERLDAPDHQSHMAYADISIEGGCPPSHPVPLPQITQNFRYTVPASGMTSWRLASDAYDGPAGYSGHADWWNGWDPDVFQRIIDNCYADGMDCRMNNLGDGERLE